MLGIVGWSILLGLAGGLGGYLVTCLAVYLALVVDISWGKNEVGLRGASWQRRTQWTMQYAAAWSIWFVPAGTGIALTYCHPDQVVWWAVVIGGMSPLLFIYLPLVWWYLLRCPSSPGVEWSAWAYYDHTSNYYLENGR